MTKPLIKTVVHGAKTVGKKAIKSASKHGLKKIVKEVAKEGASEIARAGTEKLLEQIDTISNKAKQKGASAQKIDTASAALKKGIKTASDELFENDDKLDDTTAYSDITSIATNISACASHIIPLLKKLDNYIEQINTAGRQFMTIAENVEKFKHAEHEVFSADLRSQVACGKLLGCGICEAFFADSVALKRHKCVHMGKYKCPVCKMLFATKYTLRRHQKNIHRL